MRTTVTIDPDTEVPLQEEMRRTGLSMKEVLNRSIRRAILHQSPKRVRIAVEPAFSAPFPSEFSSRSFNHLPDELDDEDTVRELGV